MIAWIVAAVPAVLVVADSPRESRFDGKPASHWVRKLGSHDEGDLREATFALSRIACCSGVGPRTSGLVTQLAAALEHADPEVRASVAAVLGCTGFEALGATKALIRALLDEDVRVRRAAALALGRIGPDAAAATALVVALRDRDAGVVENAAEALSWAEPVPHLVAALRRKERTWSEPSGGPEELGTIHSIGQGVEHALEASGEAAVSTLAAGLSDPGVFVRRTSATVLGRMERTAMAAAPALRRAARDEDGIVRSAALRALGTLGLAGGVEVLEALARPSAAEGAPPWEEGFERIAAIGAVCPPPSPEAEEAARRDADPLVIRERLAAIPAPPPPPAGALPLLVDALQDPSVKVRRAAAGALGRCGGGHAPAVDALVGSLGSTDQYLPRDATLGLARLARSSSTVVATLVDAMRRSEPAVRVRLVDALASSGLDDGALGVALREAIRDPSCSVRLEAAEALVGAGVASSEVDDAVIACLSTRAVEDRVRACFVAGAMPRPPRAAVPLLVRALRNVDDGLARSAVWALSRVDDPDAAAALVGMLGSARPALKEGVAGVLSRARGSSLIAALLDALESGDASLRSAAEGVLWQLGPEAKQAVPRLVVLLDAADPEVRGAALRLLGRIGPDARDAVPRVAAFLSRDDAKASHSALATLAAIGHDAESAVPAVLAAFRDARGLMDVAVTHALARMGPEGATLAAPPLLSAARRAGETGVDVESLAALGAAGVAVDEAVRLIAHVLEGSCASCRARAAEALGAMGPRAGGAAPALAAALLDDEQDVRVAAAAALGRIGPGARSAIPALEASLADPAECDVVQRAAGAALLAVRGE